LLQQVSLDRDTLHQGIDEAMAALESEEDSSRTSNGAPTLVAVPQEELDMLLAVRRWFMEAAKPTIIMLNGDAETDSQERAERWRNQLVAEALTIL
jgi:hypothetical protein